MTVYLHFSDEDGAISALVAAGYAISEYRDHFYKHPAWGTIFSIPAKSGWFVNLYDGDCPPSLDGYRIPSPDTPHNTRAS